MAITSYKAVVGYYNSAGTPNITTAVTGQLSDGWIPIGAPILTDAYGQCTQMMAKTDANPVIATSAYTVVTAANPQPPDATWDAQGEPLWIDTTTYLQAYTKGGAYLQGIVPVSRGGTGATTAAAARVNLGLGTVATLNTVPVANGGTGATDAAGARTNLGLGTVATLNTVPVANGGTGATTLTAARDALQVSRLVQGSTDTYITSPSDNYRLFVTDGGGWGVLNGVGTPQALAIAHGGTGATNAAQARTNLGVAYGSSSGTVAQGNDGRLNTVNGKSGGTISSDVTVTSSFDVITFGTGFASMGYRYPGTLQRVAYNFTENYGDLVFVTTQAANPGTDKYFAMRQDGSFTVPGIVTCTSVNQTSDVNYKDNLVDIGDALSKINTLRGVTFTWKDSGKPSAGIIAQELMDVLPDAVTVFKDQVGVERLGVEYAGVVALCVQAIKQLSEEVAALKSGK